MVTMPKRVALTDVETIHQALASDGAVIITGLDERLSSAQFDWEGTARALPKLVFGSRLQVEPKVAGVHLEHRELDSVTKEHGFSYSKSPLLPHTDGYIYGDNYPDYILLLVEAQAENGGESFVVDGERVVQQLDSNDVELLQERAFDLTERVPAGIANGVESFGPVLQRVGTQQRLRWKRQVRVDVQGEFIKGKSSSTGDDETVVEKYQSLWQPLTNDPSEKEALVNLDKAVQDESKRTSRFVVRNGEALLIDNFRALHAREGYSGETERKLWRVWVWTDESLGIPDGMAHVTTTLEASKL